MTSASSAGQNPINSSTKWAMTLIPGLLRYGDLDRVFPVVIRLLRFFGTWGTDRRRLLGLYGFFVSHFLVRLLPLIAYLDASSDIQTLIRHLGEIVWFLSMLYPVFFVYVWKLPKLVQLVDILERSFARFCCQDQPKEYREAIVQTNKFIRNICRFYFIYAGANIPIYIVGPPVLTILEYNSWNSTTKPFYFNFHNELPFLSHFSLWHYAICEALFVPVLVFSAIFLALKSMLYYGLIKYVSLMFKLVIKRVQLLDKHVVAELPSASLPQGAAYLLRPGRERVRLRRLEREVDNVVRHHYLALKCATMLEELISPILLAQFLGCVIVWCLFIVYITMSKGGMGAFYTLILCEIVAFEMLAFSFLASELTHVSADLAGEIYNFRWYEAPPSVQKKVLLITARSQKVVGLTALKFYYVSIEKFGKAVQTTYSFYLVMKKLFEG